MRDFCPGGVLVDLVPEPGQTAKGIDGATFGAIVDMRLSADLKGVRQEIRFFAEIRHQHLGAIGLQFQQIPEQMLNLLKALSVSKRAAPDGLPPLAESTPSALRPTQLSVKLIHGYRKVILQGLPVALERALKSASEKITLAINDSGDSWQRADFNLALQMLQTRGHWIAERVSQKVGDRLGQLIEDGTGESERKRDESGRIKLEVLEKDVFEDWLAINMAIRSVENELGHDLGTIAAILSEVTGRRFDVQSCPMGPDTIIKTLSAAFHSIELPSSALALIFKSVGKVLQSELREVYAVMVTGAERFGIKVPQKLTGEVARPVRSVQEPILAPGGSEGALPGSSSDSARSSGGSVAGNKAVQAVQGHSLHSEGRVISGHYAAMDAVLNQPGQTPYQFLTSPLGEEEVSQWQASGDRRYSSVEPAIRMLKSLIGKKARVGNGGSLSQSAHRFADTVQSEEVRANALERTVLVDSLSTLRSILESQTELQGLEGLSLEQQLQKVLVETEAHKGRTVAPEDEDLIRMTDRLFDAMLKQNGVGEILSQWVERLKLAILKILLLDDTFFADNNHPARQFINQLGKLGAVKRGANRGLDRVLEKFTSQIMDEYQGNNELLDDVLSEVNGLVERQDKAFERNADRIARAYEGQQRLAMARKQVVTELGSRLVGRPVPKVIYDFIEHASWKHYLVITLLREGEHSEIYKESLRVIDILLHWIAGEEYAYEGAHEFDIDLEAPTLLQMLERELVNSGQTGYKRILGQLKRHIIEGVEPEWVEIDLYEWTGEGAEEVSKLKDTDLVEAKGRWQRKASSLTVGDWVEFALDNEEPQRMRLAWSDTNYYRFVFVSTHGLKDIDISLEDFSGGLEEGRYRILDSDQVPIVDQGLHNMVQSVYEDLAGQASCDPLTGLLNRQEYERYVSRAVADGITNRVGYHIAYVDVDQFRVVNNSYGLQAGDSLLKHVARLISSNVAEEVICARLGGNEFGVIFQGQKKKVVMSILERIRSAIMETAFNWEEGTIYVTASIGMAELNHKSDTTDSLQRKAYLACESAKDQGRNRIVEYALHEKDQSRQDEMMSWVKRIESDLDRLLVLRCQEIRPIHASGDQSHYEVLLGVTDEQGNLLPPSKLIEAAEHYGRMGKVDRWVVSNALRWMVENPHKVQRMEGLSINLSGTSMGDESFLEFVLGLLSSSTVPMEKICFEVTETAAVTSLTYATEFINQVKKKGCKFALDDFGTGLSSYEYIQQLPVDLLKIDGVFIRNIVNNRKDEALVRSINDLAHFMGMKTIAEYVENDQIFNLLRDIGVDKAQGFGVHKPILLDELSHLH